MALCSLTRKMSRKQTRVSQIQSNGRCSLGMYINSPHCIYFRKLSKLKKFGKYEI